MALSRTLPQRFYQDALTKVKPFAEKRALMLFNLAVDLVVDATGRNQRLAGLEPDWEALRGQAKEELKAVDEAELRHLLATTFGLKTQHSILERFRQLRRRKRQASGYGSAMSQEAVADLDDDLDEAFMDEDFID